MTELEKAIITLTTCRTELSMFGEYRLNQGHIKLLDTAIKALRESEDK